MKILLYDLETSPLLSYVWEVYEANSLAVEKERELMSFAYKWLGDNSVKVFSKRTMAEKDLVRKLHELFDAADILVAHNGDNFDAKMANAFFIKQGLTPPSPYKSIDTLKIARNKFRFHSNHLNDLGKYLNIGEKVNTGGFGLWMKCMQGDKKAWKLMEKYNCQDVSLLEAVYTKIVPWMNNYPLTEVGMFCQKCGGDVQFRGPYINKKFIGKRYQCKKCGSWGISNKQYKINNEEYIKN
jgi:hypothetical protein